MRDRLIDLSIKAKLYAQEKADERGGLVCIYDEVDYLIANGVILPPCKPIPLMKDKNPLNSDVYCPNCGTNLSGYYGDEPLSVIQCFNCGELLNNTKSITREEAEKALERGKDDE